jgi:hypothetical protein
MPDPVESRLNVLEHNMYDMHARTQRSEDTCAYLNQKTLVLMEGMLRCHQVCRSVETGSTQLTCRLVESGAHKLYYGHGARPGKSNTQGWCVPPLKTLFARHAHSISSRTDAPRHWSPYRDAPCFGGARRAPLCTSTLLHAGGQQQWAPSFPTASPHGQSNRVTKRFLCKHFAPSTI